MAARDARGRFVPGCAAGPGRPKGTARALLSERFTVALAEDFARHGAAVVQALRTERPADYLKLVLALQPKEAKAEGGLEELSEAELDARIEQLAAALGFERRAGNVG